ncbi:hypothetical protein FRACYDRAFT_231986 [Fragilariopsis cylindrus CCMP1102]|uniref:Uncharacterized protein n=1 Tax=Fragilariopsis cylindrus CCMP1102 TaxID=635003 RepID=A0A1E7FUK7_9STRA|nr:hypothetical protein FRACYDRAFT_231986 [Fragilariopsis cylindrus CCMP1102]|eukprot:OEU21840.1 hypothetical protein FRACYDRAFT_231986 [Fragilariopsis cylindrus CCMP1102]
MTAIFSSSSSSSSSLFSWRKLLAISHAVLGLLSIWYCKLVYWNAAEACYVMPCYEGPGLQELWKVNKGVTFTGESSGVFAIFHAALAHFAIGIFTGCTFCASLLSLNMVYVWSAETNLLLNLSKLNPNGNVFEESGRHMIVNHSLTGKLYTLSYISSFMCFFQLLVMIQLLMARKEFTRYYRLLVSGGGGGEELSQNSEAIPLRSVLYIDEPTGASSSSSPSAFTTASHYNSSSNNNANTLMV